MTSCTRPGLRRREWGSRQLVEDDFEFDRDHVGDAAVNEYAADGWRIDWSGANCLSEDPRLWELDYYKWINEPFAHKHGWAIGSLGHRDTDGTSTDGYARRLCEGCPLIRECAEQALLAVGGLPQSGVIRAGVPLRIRGVEMGAVTRRRLLEVAGVSGSVDGC